MPIQPQFGQLIYSNSFEQTLGKRRADSIRGALSTAHEEVQSLESFRHPAYADPEHRVHMDVFVHAIDDGTVRIDLIPDDPEIIGDYDKLAEKPAPDLVAATRQVSAGRWSPGKDVLNTFLRMWGWYFTNQYGQVGLERREMRMRLSEADARVRAAEAEMERVKAQPQKDLLQARHERGVARVKVRDLTDALERVRAELKTERGDRQFLSELAELLLAEVDSLRADRDDALDQWVAANTQAEESSRDNARLLSENEALQRLGESLEQLKQDLDVYRKRNMALEARKADDDRLIGELNQNIRLLEESLGSLCEK